MGHSRAEISSADLIIINSCAVTSGAEKESGKFSRKVKRLNPMAEILETGCRARIPGASPPVEGAVLSGSFIYLDHPGLGVERFSGRSRAFLKVQQGCSGGCTYCSVKDLKKPFFLRSPERVLAEASDLARSHAEIVLCATNFALYAPLPGLVKGMRSLEGDFRWRISSVPPGVLTKELMLELEKDPGFCRHFHIPLQSASDRVLELMGRPYRMSHIRKALSDASEILEGVTFSLDIIAGFPGEEPEDFRKTLDFIRDIVPVKVHVFRYSPRPGTAAFSMKDTVGEEERKNRARLLIEVSSRMRRIRFEEAKGRPAEVVLEADGRGYTRGYLPVNAGSYKGTEKGVVRLEKVELRGSELRGTCI